MIRLMMMTVAILAAVTAGCGGGNEKPVIPTEIKQPPGPDTEGGGGKSKKPADARGGQESKDG